MSAEKIIFHAEDIVLFPPPNDNREEYQNTCRDGLFLLNIEVTWGSLYGLA